MDHFLEFFFNILFCIPDGLNLRDRLFARIGSNVNIIAELNHTVPNNIVLLIIVETFISWWGSQGQNILGNERFDHVNGIDKNAIENAKE